MEGEFFLGFDFLVKLLLFKLKRITGGFTRTFNRGWCPLCKLRIIDKAIEIVYYYEKFMVVPFYTTT